MHIGIETECLNNPITGTELSTINLVEGLSHAGHRITCYHTKCAEHPAFNSAVEHHVFQPFSSSVLKGVASLFHYSCFKKLDILHFSAPRMIYLKKPSVPTVLNVYDITPLFLPHLYSKQAHILYKYILPKFLREIDVIVVPSLATKNDLLENYKIKEEKIRVIPLALLKKSVPYRGKREPFLLCIGTLCPRKNLHGLLRAFALLQSKGVPHRLVLVGKDENQWAALSDLAIELKISDRVDYKGFLPEEEKIHLLKTASLLVMPSFYEGFGFPLLEAMSYGTPVVASNISSIPEVVGDAGILVDPHRPEDIARGIEQALCTPHEQLFQSSLKQAQLFSYEKMIGDFIQIYKELQIGNK